jgi:CheY-like chemotaxis protein
MRTPVHLIVGYCEMLLEDATGPVHADRRQVLEGALEAVHDALQLIDSSLPSTRDSITHPEMTRLHESLLEPRGRILQAVTTLIGAGGSSSDEAFTEDLLKVRSAAERLADVRRAAADKRGTSNTADYEAHDGDLQADRNQGRPARILVVDDVEDNRDILERRLKKQGHEVECAGDGREAIEMISVRQYDLVLLDVMMPEVDGYEVLERLKGSRGTRDIPVIMISALDDMSSIVRCIERGAEDYLPKPFDPVLLRARINASLEKKRLRDAEIEYLGQVSKVIEAAAAVEKGHYEHGGLSDVALRSDQLGKLARVFDSMVAEVESREDRLREQIDDLKADVERTRSTPRQEDSAPVGPSLPIGEVFAGRYNVTEVLGRGGMGAVYRAHDQDLGEDIAIKVLRPDLVYNPALIDRFKTELKLTRRLSHHNVVRTYDLGECDGNYYITMECVEGVTARELIDTRGRLGVPSTLALATQLAEALSVAHKHNVIHRDIKPQNLLLDGEGVLKVMDFGIARLAERTDAVTEAGLVVGTPAYMAPEQLLDEDVDARSDLYAVGVVMYECLTGRLPFEAKSTISLIAKLLREDPSPPTTLNREVPQQISSLIMRLLAKEPAKRIGSALELRNLLDTVE